MPHILVEYADDEQVAESIDGLLDEIAAFVDRSTVIELSNLKLRAKPYQKYSVGGALAPFVHISVAMMYGPDRADLDRLLDDMHALVSTTLAGRAQVTAELRLIEPKNYKKTQPSTKPKRGLGGMG